MAVVVETTIGDFTVDLYTKERPQTCRNFLKLCKIKYYNWSLFFTVQSNFIAQTGDPTSTGKGGESIYGIVLGEKARYYEGEQMPKLKHDKAGLLSMVNCGDNMLGSQFFITLAADLQSLDGEHCVFGEITEGLEIILKFNEIICDTDHRPYQDIRISHTVILEDPYDDPKGLNIPDRSPEPTKEVLMSDRIGADEAIDDTAGMTMEEIAEMQKEKEAKARATILEIVGDIPDAEMAPPENVLFVCKLNPVTNDDDLEIIFSRFGKIVGCEVIRDRQTGDSLQYAFIEFAERKSCEEAYFKMDNVLIDDRRIHVDFSQSVAKMRWRGKGKGIKYFDEDEKKENKQSEDNRKNKFEKRRNRSESPKKERNKYDEKDMYRSKKSSHKQESSGAKDVYRKPKEKDQRPNHKRQERSRSKSGSRSRYSEKHNRRNDRSVSRSRSRSNEKIKTRKNRIINRSRSRSTEKNRKRKNKSTSRSRSRSNEKIRRRKNKSSSRSRSRSKSNEKSKRKKNRSRSRSRSNEKNRRKKERSKSKERNRDKREISADRNRERRRKSKECIKNKRDSSNERDDMKNKYRNNKAKNLNRNEYDRYANNKIRRKSRDRSEEKYESSGYKHKSKLKNR